MIDRLRAQTGQTATEYLGVVLVAAAIVSVILSSSSGIAEAITGQVERAFCTLAAGEPRPQAPPTRTAIGHRGRVRETSTATASPTRPRPRAGPIRTRPTWTATG